MRLLIIRRMTSLVIILLIGYFLMPLSLCGQSDFEALIRSVQANSQKSYDEIHSVEFKGYSKTYFYFGYNPLDVDVIPFHNEYYFDGYWMKPDSLRMVIRALRDIRPDSTGGMDIEIEDSDLTLPNPFHFTYSISAFGIDEEDNDEEIVLMPLYPFAATADSMYTYRQEGEIGFGENRVFVIHVQPKNNNIPGAVGSFLIDAYRHEVVGSDIHFNEATSVFEQAAKQGGAAVRLFASGTNNHRIKTKKELHYGQYWLPVSMEEEFDIGFWGMDVKAHRFITFDTYIVNPEHPNPELLTDEQVIIKRDPELEKRVFEDLPHPNKLSREEEQRIIRDIKDQLVAEGIYDEILESEAMAIEAGRMALANRLESKIQFIRSLGDYIVYNRVEGLRLQSSITATDWPIQRLSLSAMSAYGFADERLKGEGSLLLQLTKKRKLFLDASAFHSLGYMESRTLNPTARNTFSSLVWKGDYRDYFFKTGFAFGAGARISQPLTFRLVYTAQKESTADIHARYSIFRNKIPVRPNPDILEGRHRNIKVALIYRTADMNVDIAYTHSNTTSLRSDFSYRLLEAQCRRRWRVSTQMDLRFNVNGIWSWGALPPQRWFDFGGRSFQNYYGNLRGVSYKMFTGDRGAYATLEYSIKGTILGNVGNPWGLLRILKLTLWGGFSWSKLSDRTAQLASGLDVPKQTTDGLYQEYGIGIGDALNIFRLDFIRTNQNDKGILFRFNVLQ